MKLSFALSFVVCAFLSFGAYAEKVIAFDLASHTAEESRIKEWKDLETEKQGIVDVVSDISCKGKDSCRVVGLGKRACGGYEGFLLYSLDNVSEAEFLEKVSGYNGRTSMYNQKHAVSSICSIEIEPKLQCVENRCQKVKGF